MAQRPAHVIAHPADRPELPIPEAQCNSLAINAQLLQGLASEFLRRPKVSPVGNLLHASNSATESRILGRRDVRRARHIRRTRRRSPGGKQ